MKFSRLLGGGSALASAAAAIADDELEEPGAAEPGDAGQSDPGDESTADDAAEPAPQLEPEAPAEPADTNAAVATARAEERQRVAAVFASDDVKGREQAAVMLLTETDMTAEKIVAKLPSLSPAAASDPMLGRLSSQENPDLGAGAEASGSGSDAKASWARTFERLGWDK